MDKGIIQLVGIDCEPHRQLCLPALKSCVAVVASERLRHLVPQMLADFERRRIIPMVPLAEALSRIELELAEGDVAVLASGDPLFFGIGRRLIETFGKERVRVHPALSSIQQLCARFGVVWDDAVLLSLHGRKQENYLGSLLASAKTILLTDNHNRPEVIAKRMLAFLRPEEADRFTAYVGEDLGMRSERLLSGPLTAIADQTFGSLTCMALVCDQAGEGGRPRFGLREEEIVHSRGLITKNEVRAAVLHALALPARSIMWDVGAGSGSVGIEAARLQPDLLVYAVEKESRQLENIAANKRRYGILTIKTIEGAAPEALEDLPRPQRIFIGGSGGRLAPIIDRCCESLLPGGRIVLTAVLEQTGHQAPALLHARGLEVEVSRLTVERALYPPGETTVLNPITIIVGKKVDG